MSTDPNDGVPIFDSLHEADEIAVSGGSSEAERIGAEATRDAMREGWDAETLNALPSISEGQADTLHVDEAERRIWLSRTGVADGEPYENTVSIEQLQGGRWVTVCKYDGGDLDEDDGASGQFVVEVDLSNAAMQEAGAIPAILHKVADQIETSDETERPIIDGNGNTVGRFTFHDHN